MRLLPLQVGLCQHFQYNIQDFIMQAINGRAGRRDAAGRLSVNAEGAWLLGKCHDELRAMMSSRPWEGREDSESSSGQSRLLAGSRRGELEEGRPG